MGYSKEELASARKGSDLGLGCGNPQAIAALRPGETVLDLGSGAGSIASWPPVASAALGRVIGVDMTPEMVTKARANARRVDAANVEFRLGEIEHCLCRTRRRRHHLELRDQSGARQGRRLPRGDPGPQAGRPTRHLGRRRHPENPCRARGERRGAHGLRRGRGGGRPRCGRLLTEAGFEAVVVDPRPDSRAIIGQCMPGAEDYLASARIEGRKPGGANCCAPSCCT